MGKKYEYFLLIHLISLQVKYITRETKSSDFHNRSIINDVISAH